MWCCPTVYILLKPLPYTVRVKTCAKRTSIMHFILKLRMIFFFFLREKGYGQKIGIIAKIEMLFSEDNAACKWEIDYAM